MATVTHNEDTSAESEITTPKPHWGDSGKYNWLVPIAFFVFLLLMPVLYEWASEKYMSMRNYLLGVSVVEHAQSETTDQG